MDEPRREPERFVDEENERVRRERIRRDAARPMSVNLAEGIAHSHKLWSFAGSARRAVALKRRTEQ